MKYNNILVYGYGEPNGDDNIGIESVNMLNGWLESRKKTNVETKISYSKDPDYELIELSKYDKVLFVNVTKDPNIHEFIFGESENLSGTEICTLSIKGYESCCVTDNAKLNLEQAFRYLTRKIYKWS